MLWASKENLRYKRRRIDQVEPAGFAFLGDSYEQAGRKLTVSVMTHSVAVNLIRVCSWPLITSSQLKPLAWSAYEATPCVHHFVTGNVLCLLENSTTGTWDQCSCSQNFTPKSNEKSLHPKVISFQTAGARSSAGTQGSASLQMPSVTHWVKQLLTSCRIPFISRVKKA